MMSEQLTGRDLDAAVAERVMGWKLFDSDGETWACANAFAVKDGKHNCCANRVRTQKPGDVLMFAGRSFGFFPPGWSPSTNIADAFQVVERLQATPCRDGDHFHFQLHNHGSHWRAVFHHWLMSGPSDALALEWFQAVADTAPLAICWAALEAVKAQPVAGGAG